MKKILKAMIVEACALIGSAAVTGGLALALDSTYDSTLNEYKTTTEYSEKLDEEIKKINSKNLTPEVSDSEIANLYTNEYTEKLLKNSEDRYYISKCNTIDNLETSFWFCAGFLTASAFALGSSALTFIREL